MLKAASNLLPNGVFSCLTAAYFKASALKQNGLRGMHSTPSLIQLEKLNIQVLPALSDNYMYLIVDKATNQAAIIDPVAPDDVLKAVAEQQVNLTKVLTTHHHWDHAGGNLQLIQKSKNPLQVFGGDDRIDGLTNKVGHGDSFTIGEVNVECLATPCHTTGHICYYLTAPGQTPVVFTGDTLFIAGCGRFFEGTAEQMYSALVEKLGKLPDNTQVFCGHEYTVSNLKFAQHVERDNADIKTKLAWAMAQREGSMPTVPGTISEEKRINPFMRVHAPGVQKHASCSEPLDTMRVIRKEKDSFKA